MAQHSDSKPKMTPGDPRPQTPPLPRSAKPKPKPPVRFDDWAMI